MQWLALILTLPYLYLLLKIYSNLIKIRPYKPETGADLFVSLVVACKNEENSLPSLLSDLSSQDYDPEMFEVIITDDNSTDSTFRIASGFTGIKNLMVIRNSGSGKKMAVRTGVEASSGKLVITTDADCRMGKHWLNTIVSYYTENKPEMIIGPVMLNGGKGFRQRFQELEFLSLQGVTAGTTIAGNPVMCNGANMAFTKAAYLENPGNLHPEKVSGDDVFLLHGIKRKKENKILWLESGDAIIITHTSGTLSAYFSQRARWLSKAGSYTDSNTILLGIVTFVTILLQPLLLIAGIFNPVYLLVFVASFILKSIPDFLILRNTTSRYGRRDLMKWFIPSQIFYTYYILMILPAAIFKGNRWDK